jgi:hypothetical protein
LGAVFLTVLVFFAAVGMSFLLMVRIIKAHGQLPVTLSKAIVAQ